MKRYRGFKLGRKLVKVFKWITRHRRKRARHHHLDPPAEPFMSKICALAKLIQRGVKDICFPKSDPGYNRLGREELNEPMKIPKGHLAVYVGQSDVDTKRVLVPVIYFNHPLFGELLKDAERVYGFNQPGGITIPCEISEFERVQTRIATWNHCRRHRRRLG